MGKPRSQSRKEVTRTLHLCDQCFERLRADQLNDLFLRSVAERKQGREPSQSDELGLGGAAVVPRYRPA
jgi:hypothetical protein